VCERERDNLSLFTNLSKTSFQLTGRQKLVPIFARFFFISLSLSLSFIFINQRFPNIFSLLPYSSQLCRKMLCCCHYFGKGNVFIFRDSFLNTCLSPHLNLMSPHVANGDKVGQRCSR
jgi:hypothetical protein